MKKRNFSIGSLLLCLLEILVGVLLLINPVSFTSGIIVAFGVILLAAGVIHVIRYFRTEAHEAAQGQILLKGLLALLGGGFCVLRFRWLVATFPLLTILYGLATLVAGLGKVQWTVDALRLGQRRWFLAAISAAVSLLCAVVILANPFATTAVLWTFTGISLIVEAVMDAVALLLGSGAKAAAETEAEEI